MYGVRRFFRPSAVLAVLLGLPVVGGCAAPPAAEVARGLDLDGHAVDPLAGEHAATVLLFIASDCPISNRYAPELQRITDEFGPRGVAVYLVYPNPEDTAEVIERHRQDYGLRSTALRDPRHALVQRAGVDKTPEAAVFSGDRTLVYRGRIDDWYADFGKSRPEPTRHDLREVLEALLEGERPALRTTAAVGCYIASLE